MFKIIKDGTSLGMTEAPTYVRQAENGCFVLCQEDQATGIAYGGPCTTSWAGRPWRARRA